ncbi:CDP-glycerol glycerophosphotransferase family protein [Longibaculum muris]|uniref:CDP-glycerol glycerophosphotransferase family protein n=1 Tax=Longibaculum muris TaxID=1796628 RepID=UPI0029437B82|nr:CDP-glycerol glycerophosphotransferase family protein [Longibaculum muris]
MKIIVKIGIFFLNIVFSIFKLLPVQKKITYISRQMNTTPLDFKMVIENIHSKDSTYKHVVLAKMLTGGMKGYISYSFHIFKQMYHIATSQAVILDTYCIPISILKQRKKLIIIQMWHALGAFKKFGYSILDQPEGSSSKLAKLMRMHYNYTYVLSSSQYTVPFFAEAFHVPIDKVIIYPLPKTDLLCERHLKEAVVQKIYNYYPDLERTKKKIIVYAPTFRKIEDGLYKAIKDLLNCIDFDHYEFVLKKHPLTQFSINDPRIIEDQYLTSLEFFHIADYIITDYSAVLFEASLLKKPIYFYAFDYDTYMKKRSLYIDYYNQLPGPVYQNPKDIINAIQDNHVDYDKIEKFRKLMIAPCTKSYTDDFVDFLLDKLS